MKRISLFILLALLGLLFAPCEASAKKKSYFIADYDVVMDVEENGDVRVSETIRYAFTRGTFTYAYRTVPLTGFEDIDVISVTSPDGPLRLTRAEVTEGWTRRLQLRWSFPATDQSRTFRIDYIARGLVKSERGQNVIDWNAVGRDWNVPIRDIDVQVKLPWRFASGIETDPPAEIHRLDGETFISFHHDALRPRQRFHIVVRFPGMIASASPSEMRYGLRILLMLISGSLVIGVLLLTFVRRVGRVAAPAVSTAVTSYPDPQITIAEAAGLVYAHSGRPKAAISAIVFDLARRGLIKIESVIRRRFLGSRSFDIRAQVIEHPPGLPPWEEKVLAALEHEHDLKAFSRKRGLFSDILDELTARLRSIGLISTEREQQRRRWILMATVALGVAVIFLILVVISVWRELLAPAILGLLASTGLLIVSSAIDTRTPRGAALKRAFQNYGRGLREEIERLMDTEPAHAIAMLIEHLPLLVLDTKVNRRWFQMLKKKWQRSEATFAVPEWMELKDQAGQQLATAMAATECFGLFTDSVVYVAAYSGGGYGAGGGAGAAGSGAGGGGGGAG